MGVCGAKNSSSSDPNHYRGAGKPSDDFGGIPVDAQVRMDANKPTPPPNVQTAPAVDRNDPKTIPAYYNAPLTKEEQKAKAIGEVPSEYNKNGLSIGHQLARDQIDKKLEVHVEKQVAAKKIEDEYEKLNEERKVDMKTLEIMAKNNAMYEEETTKTLELVNQNIKNSEAKKKHLEGELERKLQLMLTYREKDDTVAEAKVQDLLRHQQDFLQIERDISDTIMEIEVEHKKKQYLIDAGFEKTANQNNELIGIQLLNGAQHKEAKQKKNQEMFQFMERMDAAQRANADLIREKFFKTQEDSKTMPVGDWLKMKVKELNAPKYPQPPVIGGSAVGKDREQLEAFLKKEYGRRN